MDERSADGSPGPAPARLSRPPARLLGRLRSTLQDLFGTPGFAGLFACCCVLGLASSFVVPFLSLWGTLYVGMTPLLFASFMTLNSVSALVASTWLARWSDTRLSRRTVLLLASSCGALGYLGYAFIRQPFVLMAIGATAMSVSSVNFSQVFAHARESLARSGRARGNEAFELGVLRAAFSLAWTVGPALGALILEHLGYRGSFLSAAGLLLLYLALVLAFIPAEPAKAAAPTAGHESLWRLLLRPRLLGNFAAFALMFGAVSLNLMNLPLFITQELGGSERQVGAAFAVAPFFEIPFMLGLGRLATRERQTRVIRLGLLVGAAYFLAIGFARAPQHIYPAQVLNAFSIAVTMSVAIPYFQDLLPGQPGLATSLYASSWSVGSLLGYFGFGFLVERMGHRGLTELCAAVALLALLVVVFAGRRSVTASE